jgi:hypothetical protein
MFCSKIKKKALVNLQIEIDTNVYLVLNVVQPNGNEFGIVVLIGMVKNSGIGFVEQFLSFYLGLIQLQRECDGEVDADQ